MDPLNLGGSSSVAQMIKCLPTMWETRVRSLGQEVPLEKEMAIHSSTLAWKIPWMEEPDWLHSMGSQRVGHDWATYVLWRKQQQNHWDATSMQWSNWAKGKASVKAEAPILWPPDAKHWLVRKDPSAGKDWRQEEKGMTEDEMVGWHHRLDGHEFKQAPGVGDV